MYELAYTISRWLNYIWSLNIKLIAITKERICIELCNLHNSLILSLCALKHLIFTSICVT